MISLTVSLTVTVIKVGNCKYTIFDRLQTTQNYKKFVSGTPKLTPKSLKSVTATGELLPNKLKLISGRAPNYTENPKR